MSSLGKRKYKSGKSLAGLRKRAKGSGNQPPQILRGWKPFVGVNQELKVQDIATATYQINTTGSITLLAIPTVSADFTGRIGRKVTLKSLYLRGRVRAAGAGTMTAQVTPEQQARLMIIYDLQPNAEVPTILDILNTADPASQTNLSNRERFRILCDKEYCFDPVVSVTTATQAQMTATRTCYNLKLYKKLNLSMIFNAVNGGTIADINSGALYMVWIGSAVASSTGDAEAVVSTRVRYSDL